MDGWMDGRTVKLYENALCLFAYNLLKVKAKLFTNRFS